MFEASLLELIATFIFALAIIHTFSIKFFQNISYRYRKGSSLNNLFHLLGEVEIVFGFWAGLFLAILFLMEGKPNLIQYTERLNFTEPMFVFVIMAISSTRPVINFAKSLILAVAKLIPLKIQTSFYIAALVLGPLLGSFITEPAAMTVTAFLLKDTFFDQNVSVKAKYVTIAALFVNISIGGTLTHFAAPPVLMVASTWNWDMGFMVSNFGIKSVIAILINTAIVSAFTWKELNALEVKSETFSTSSTEVVPKWVVAIHLFVLALVVMTSHYPILFGGLFLFFLGLTTITQQHQEELKLKESLLVAFFLAGLVVLGTVQAWWLKPVLASFGATDLFLGTTFLTAFTDNAALTYLGSQVSNLSDAQKYALVAGAVAGGGLTVIANAPNPAGFSILNNSFGPSGIGPLQLFASALPLTLIAMACLWYL